jgi:thiol-disulfide isomerase/thioredoxin
MTKPVTAATALLLALALAGCSSDGEATDAGATASVGASAMENVESSAMAEDDAMMMDDDADSAMSQDDDAALDDSDPAMETDDAAMATEGAWIDEAAYESDKAGYHAAGDVVLFFNATWCPTCKETVESLDEDGVPAGLTVVSVDYDSNAGLKKQYGVTVQHTFVQVDESGEQLAKFTGSTTGKQIAAKTA